MHRLIAKIAWKLMYLRSAEMSNRELLIAAELIRAKVLQWGDDGKLEACDEEKFHETLNKE